MATDSKTTERSRSPRESFWILAYLLSPALAFFCLRSARVIGRGECSLGVSAGLLTHLGLLSVMIETEGDPLQGFLLLLMASTLYLVLMWQYLAGQRGAFWSQKALKRWQLAGRFFGGLLAFSFLGQLILFHLGLFVKGR